MFSENTSQKLPFYTYSTVFYRTLKWELVCRALLGIVRHPHRMAALQLRDRVLFLHIKQDACEKQSPEIESGFTG